MTPDERNILQQFLGDLDASRGATKDNEADAMIAGALRANPDAAYLLVQHAILADQALQAAQQRIETLQEPSAPAPFPGGVPPQQASYSDTQPALRPQSPLSAHGGLGGFLRGAGTLAAGVAGGEFLAQGLSNLFSPQDW